MQQRKILTQGRIGTHRNTKILILIAILFFSVTFLLFRPELKYDISPTPGSMYPETTTGNAFLIIHVAPSAIRVGDVIVFKRGQTDVMHRVIGIIKVDGTYYFNTIGDSISNSNLDSTDGNSKDISQEYLVGKMVYNFGIVSPLLFEIHNNLTDLPYLFFIVLIFFIDLELLFGLFAFIDLKRMLISGRKAFSQNFRILVLTFIILLLFLSELPKMEIMYLSNSHTNEITITNLIKNKEYSQIEGIYVYYYLFVLSVKYTADLNEELDHISFEVSNGTHILGRLQWQPISRLYGQFNISLMIRLNPRLLRLVQADFIATAVMFSNVFIGADSYIGYRLPFVFSP